MDKKEFQEDVSNSLAVLMNAIGPENLATSLKMMAICYSDPEAGSSTWAVGKDDHALVVVINRKLPNVAALISTLKKLDPDGSIAEEARLRAQRN